MNGPSAGGDPPAGHAGPSVTAGLRRQTPNADVAAERLARLVFGLLVLACFVALIVTQRLKHTPTVVQNFEMTPTFSPSSTGPHREEHLSFKLSKADEVTVTIVNSREEDVARLLRNVAVPRYKQFSLRWNGRLGTAHGYTVLRSPDGHKSLLPVNRGSVAPLGEYSVRVSLRGQDRSVLSQRTFKLVAR